MLCGSAPHPGNHAESISGMALGRGALTGARVRASFEARLNRHPKRRTSRKPLPLALTTAPLVAISPRTGSAEMTGGAIAGAGWVIAVMGCAAGAGTGAGSARANSAALGSVGGGATTVATGCGAAIRADDADAA